MDCAIHTWAAVTKSCVWVDRRAALHLFMSGRSQCGGYSLSVSTQWRVAVGTFSLSSRSEYESNDVTSGQGWVSVPPPDVWAHLIPDSYSAGPSPGNTSNVKDKLWPKCMPHTIILNGCMLSSFPLLLLGSSFYFFAFVRNKKKCWYWSSCGFNFQMI